MDFLKFLRKKMQLHIDRYCKFYQKNMQFQKFRRHAMTLCQKFQTHKISIRYPPNRPKDFQPPHTHTDRCTKKKKVCNFFCLYLFGPLKFFCFLILGPFKRIFSAFVLAYKQDGIIVT